MYIFRCSNTKRFFSSLSCEARNAISHNQARTEFRRNSKARDKSWLINNRGVAQVVEKAHKSMLFMHDPMSQDSKPCVHMRRRLLTLRIYSLETCVCVLHYFGGYYLLFFLLRRLDWNGKKIMDASALRVKFQSAWEFTKVRVRRWACTISVSKKRRWKLSSRAHAPIRFKAATT